MVKVAIIVGHDSKKKGAKLNLNATENEPAVYEYDWNKSVAKQIEFLRGIYKLNVDILFRDNIGIYGAYLEAIKKQPDFILELHFNSNIDNRVKGAEILCSKAYKGHLFPGMYLARCVKLFGGVNRGIKNPDKTRGDRGYGNVNRPIPYFLLEPFFGSNFEQAKFASENMIQYALLIMDAIKEYENVTTRSSTDRDKKPS